MLNLGSVIVAALLEKLSLSIMTRYLPDLRKHTLVDTEDAIFFFVILANPLLLSPERFLSGLESLVSFLAGKNATWVYVVETTLSRFLPANFSRILKVFQTYLSHLLTEKGRPLELVTHTILVLDI